MKKKMFPVYLTQGEKKILAEAALADGRSLSAYLVRHALRQAGKSLSGVTTKLLDCDN